MKKVTKNFISLGKCQIIYVEQNPCIFRETKFRDRKFPDRTLQEGKLWDQKIPGISICHGIWNFFGEKIPGFYFEQGRKFQDF